MARNPITTLKDFLFANMGDKSDDVLANTLREADKTVILTHAAYDALSPKDPNTLYYIVG